MKSCTSKLDYCGVLRKGYRNVGARVDAASDETDWSGDGGIDTANSISIALAAVWSRLAIESTTFTRNCQQVKLCYFCNLLEDNLVVHSRLECVLYLHHCIAIRPKQYEEPPRKLVPFLGYHPPPCLSVGDTMTL